MSNIAYVPSDIITTTDTSAYNQVSGYTCPSCGLWDSNYYHVCQPAYLPTPVQTIYVQTPSFTDYDTSARLTKIERALERIEKILQNVSAPPLNAHEEVCGCDDEGCADQASDTRGNSAFAELAEFKEIVRELAFKGV